MTINYTSLLGLAKPVTGTETGQWGDVVNNEITSLLEDAVANAATISVTAGNVTLSTTNGSSNQARMSTLIITGTPGTTRNVVAPSQAKIYVVVNQSDSSVVIKGAATTGITVAAGQTAQVVWNGTDFVEVGNYVHGNFIVNGNLTVKGNTTLGDAAGDSLTVNATVTSNLIFTDNTYDIGASGATRPRTIYAGTSIFAPLMDATNLEVTNIKALDGTAAASIANSTGAITVSTLLNVDNLRLDGNTISSTDTNGNIIIAPNGTGQVQISNAALDLTTIEVTNIRAKDGTASITLADATGVATFSANPILNAGTANGVLYLNGSKVATSGSALTFDGSTFLTSVGSNLTTRIKQLVLDNYTNDGVGITFPRTSDGAEVMALGVADVDKFGLFSRFGLIFATAGGGVYSAATEKMRITETGQVNIGGNFTSTNNTLQVTGNAAIGYTAAAPTTGLIVAGDVGIGTDSPGRPLHVASSSTSYLARFQNSGSAIALINFKDNTTGDFSVGVGATGENFVAYTSNTERARLDSSGTLILRQSSNAANTSVSFNTTVQNALTLDSSGNVGVGATPSAWAAYKAVQIGRGSFVSDTSSSSTYGTIVSANWFYDGANKYIINGLASFYQQDAGQHRWWTAANNTSGAGASMSPSQAMTLDASGNLLLGLTSGTAKFDMAAGAGAAVAAIRVRSLSTNSNGFNIVTDSVTDNIYLNNFYNAAMLFGTNNTERARITSGGYFKASDNGTYVGSTATYHEFRQTAQSSIGLVVNANNATFNNNVLYISASRNTTNNSFYAITYDNDGAGASRFRVADSGAIATAGGIALGTATPATSGIGVQFPATQSASSDANTLDDYEEGTWTPTYYGSTSAGTTTYSAQVGLYVKVGRLVTVNFTLAVTGATGTGDIRIGGLPFTANNQMGTVGSIMASNLTWAGDYLSVYLDGNGTVMRVYRTTAGAGINDTAIDAVCELYGTVTYQV